MEGIFSVLKARHLNPILGVKFCVNSPLRPEAARTRDHKTFTPNIMRFMVPLKSAMAAVTMQMTSSRNLHREKREEEEKEEGELRNCAYDT